MVTLIIHYRLYYHATMQGWEKIWVFTTYLYSPMCAKNCWLGFIITIHQYIYIINITLMANLREILSTKYVQ